MISFRKFSIFSISLTSMSVSLFFLLIIFLPHSSLLPPSALLTELQEVGPLLLSSMTGDDLLSFLVLDDQKIPTTSKPPESIQSSDDFLLIALARYVGVLGFSKSEFYETMYVPWNIIMITCMFLSFLHFSVSILMLLYISLLKKYPKLLLPWICFNIPLLTIVLTVLVSLMVAMATSLTQVQVQDAHCYIIIIICVTSVMPCGEIFLVLTEFMQEQRAATMMPEVPQEQGHSDLQEDSLDSGLSWGTCIASWTSSASSAPSTRSASTQPPTYDQVLQNQKPPYARLPFDEAQDIIPQIPNFHSLPLSSFIGQPHSEVPVFNTNNQPWYLPTTHPYPHPHQYPGHTYHCDGCYCFLCYIPPPSAIPRPYQPW